MSKHLPLLAILWAYLLAGSLYAVYTPPWQAPDEPAHYNYIRQLANGRFPIMQNQDYDEAYRNAAVSSGFAPQYDITRLSYEDYQPPLYYLLQTPLFWLTDGNLVTLRLMAVLMGALTLALAYSVAQHVFQQRWLTLTAVAFIAFLPQHVAIQASLNNDALSELLIAAMLAVLVRYHPHHQRENRLLRLLAVLLGLGFLTKVTTYLMAPVIAVPLLWHYWPQVSIAIRKGLQQVALPAALIGSLWWVRNLAVYGWPDFLGIQAHDAAVVGQLLTRDYIARQGANNALQAFLYTTFTSFWGQFGWMGVMMQPWVYQTLFLFSGLVLLGFIIHLRSPGSAKIATPHRLILVTLFLFNLALYLTYNVTYVQHQARYLFASLIPISIGVAAGCEVYTRPLVSRWPAVRYLLPFALSVGLFGLDLLALFRFIIPTLAT